MSDRLVLSMMCLGVSAVEVVHPIGKIWFRRFDNEMIVVFHEAVGVTEPRVSINGLSQYIQKFLIVPFAVEDALAGIPTRCDVVDRSGKFNS